MPNLAQDLAKPNFLRCIHGVGWGGVGYRRNVEVEEGGGGLQVSIDLLFNSLYLKLYLS